MGSSVKERLGTIGLYFPVIIIKRTVVFFNLVNQTI